MLRSWTGAVKDLSEFDPSHAHRVSVAGSLDEEEEAGDLSAPPGGAPGGSPGVQRQPAPAL